MNENVEQDESAEPGFWNRIFCDLFEIDLRSLAIFRIALGLLILVDLANRVPNLEMFFTDDGILTRDMARTYLGSGFWSLYWIDGSIFFTRILFVLTAVAVVCLVAGFKTRLMTVICLILVSSLQVCNPLVLTGGHVEMRVLLFWSMFLPLGAVWSIDARISSREEPERWRIASIATMAIMLQVACIYFFSGIAKLNGYWFSGHAVESVLSLEMTTKPLGEALRQYPGFLMLVGYVTVFFEVVGPILLFVPWHNKFNRGMVMAVFWLMHITIWLTMSIGIFSLMAMAAWLVFVPSQLWEVWDRPEDAPPTEIQWARTPRQLFGSIFCGLALVYVLALNIANIDEEKSGWFSPSLRALGNATLTIQEFKLFARPPVDSPAFEYQAELLDGSQIDIFWELMNGPVEKSDSVYRYFPTQHWRRVHLNLVGEPNLATDVEHRIRYRFLDRIVTKWNRTHNVDRNVSWAKLNCYRRAIEPQGKYGPPIKEVWAEWSQESIVD